MAITKPYKRTVRQLADGSYQNSGNGQYIRHAEHAQSPQHYLRAFQIVQKDLIELFDYIEPADANLLCYSHRILELHARCCFEIEANCAAILRENGYARSGDWTMRDYRKINASHRMSSYEVKLPAWSGNQDTFKPFQNWSGHEQLPWYQAYNRVKHSRHAHFTDANLGNLVEAACALAAIFSAQFINEDGLPDHLVAESSRSDGFDFASGHYFLIKFPNDWPMEERYDFDWQTLKTEPEPFQAYTYPAGGSWNFGRPSARD
ncbi:MULTISPECIES: hypothetical protein [Bradyrhizobium]|uniref:hypothetical protein n=1 Tax=Bradyrhizobium TaxID=374 RepID=UPI000231CBE5|nr:hypothetical protein [Bradyrhizobium japonicum]MCS3533917.1 hypothetical protein [Bradyrhizobium japonicum]MCS3989989.1 hypothetical protein [Bradyrhizobium japonicum]MCS4015198.1 hypothetical protein [Bradyrhizobium japonicum]MCS4202292.1 hypothetical protein [Bradyrhizobium japonicum]MDH6174572.1 hypothetical protein [Bradyrhizobium japonicum]